MKFCDLCGFPVDNVYTLSTDNPRMQSITRMKLCNGCCDKVLHPLQHILLNKHLQDYADDFCKQIEPVEEITEEIIPEAKPEKRRYIPEKIVADPVPKRRFDIKSYYALRAAGWSKVEIAKEFGLDLRDLCSLVRDSMYSDLI